MKLSSISRKLLRIASSKRRFLNSLFSLGVVLSAILVVAPLFIILVSVAIKGGRALNLDFFLSLPKAVGESGGGIAHAIVGTLFMVGTGLLFSIPIGVASGVFLATTSNKRLSAIVRTSADCLAGVPSIVTGLFVYALLVVPFKRFSGFAGAVALSIIMLPTITRTTEEVVRMVPHDLFESAIALGAKRWQAVFRVVLPTASRGILAGFIGAASRAMGETAPLMFTAFGSHFLNLNPFEPVSAIPLVIFNYAISPYEDWQQKAWAASLVLTFLVLGGIIVSRRLVYGRFG